ncbi:hypothetical protein B0T24DRAFT_593274 [Lasiosphaeria ovina]|uniref:Uncharacterized protein n=1 Tax=Lasiosphaeria ovina TaxID=92902 RepID=A0AAE0N6W9_9PEZI|nr:hypothetical protein B0T24DRAFT_593274 [Lasiosphaeria ovina]
MSAPRSEPLPDSELWLGWSGPPLKEPPKDPNKYNEIPKTKDQISGVVHHQLDAFRFSSIYNPDKTPMNSFTRDGQELPEYIAEMKEAHFHTDKPNNRVLIGRVLWANISRMMEVAGQIMPAQCMKYAVCVLAELEREGLVPRGGAELHARDVTYAASAQFWEAHHPVPNPSIKLPKSWPMPRPDNPKATLGNPSEGMDSAARPSSVTTGSSADGSKNKSGKKK